MEEIRRLESWKEIAGYLKRSVRTCRRWENELGLPIHRLDGTPSARVFAYPGELDQWMEEKLNHVRAEAKERGSFCSRKRRRLVLASGAVVVLGVVAVLVWPLFSTKPVPVPADNPILAVLPFENLTGDEVLESWRTAFPDLLITDLRQSRYVNVVPVSNIYAVLNNLKLEGVKTFSAQELTRIADETEADFMAKGSLIRSGEDFVVNIFVQDLSKAEADKALRANVRGEQGLLDKADDLTKEIKRALNLSPRQMACDIDESVRRISTHSPQAWKLWSQASHIFSSDQISPGRVSALREAIGLDPEFALAYDLLRSVHAHMPLDDVAQCYQKALSLPGRLSERERLHIQADFYRFYKALGGYPKLTEVDFPVAALEKLGPKDTGEAMDVLERLRALYPDFYGDGSDLRSLSRIYELIEEWDKAISVVEKGMITPLRRRALSATLIRCYLARGMIDQAEKVLADLIAVNPDGDYDNIRLDLAWDRRNFNEVFERLKESYAIPGRKTFPYSYFSQVGYAHWLKDDLDKAEKAYQIEVVAADKEDEWDRSADLAAVYLSQGKIAKALEYAHKGLVLARNLKETPYGRRERENHYILAYLYRLAGRLPEALKEAAEACLDHRNPSVPAGLTIQSLRLRAMITLEMGRLEDFEKQLGEIKEFSELERYPKLMRAYYHLLGLKEMRQNRMHKAIACFNKAIDLSTPKTRNNDPAMILYSLAEVHEYLGSPWAASRAYAEISGSPRRGSFTGDIYARSFYRNAKLSEHDWLHYPGQNGQSRTKAIENYRKFLSLWGDADPIFAEVADARARLAALEAE